MFFFPFKELVLLLLLQQINSATWLEILSRLGLLRSQQATLVSKDSGGLLQFLAKLQYFPGCPPLLLSLLLILLLLLLLLLLSSCKGAEKKMHV